MMINFVDLAGSEKINQFEDKSMFSEENDFRSESA